MHKSYYKEAFLSWGMWKILIVKEYISLSRQKRWISNTGGVSFCWIGIPYAMPYTQKHAPPHRLFPLDYVFEMQI